MLCYSTNIDNIYQEHTYCKRHGGLVNYSVMSDFATPQIVAHQAPLSMGFSRQEY